MRKQASCCLSSSGSLPVRNVAFRFELSQEQHIQHHLAVPRILECAAILSMWRRNGIKRSSLHLHGTCVPRIDIFVTYCAEGIPLALDTIRATLALDYPSTSTRIIILDDSDSSTLASAIQDRFSASNNNNVYYTSRREHISGHSKAANLNWGLKYSSLLPGGPSDFLAVLDVDMIPEPYWLRSLLPHMLSHPSVGIVNPPQNYYNTPPSDPYDEGGSMIRVYAIVMALLDGSDNATCTGTGFIPRRSAIGARSLMSHAVAGSGDGKAKSTFGRAVATKALLPLHTLHYLTGTVNMVLVPWVLVWEGSASLLDLSPRSFNLLLGLCLADFGAQLLYGSVLRWLTLGRARVFQHLATLWLAPHELLRFLLPRGPFEGRHRKIDSYVPTNTPSEDEKKVANLPYFKRLGYVFIRNLALLHCMVLVLCTTGACYSIYDVMMKPETHIRARPVETYLTLGVLWPPFVLIWTAYIANAWTPVSCLLFPFVRPARESLLVQSPTADAVYPSPQAKANWYRKKRGGHLYVTVVYHALVLVASCLLHLDDTEGRNVR